MSECIFRVQLGPNIWHRHIYICCWN